MWYMLLVIILASCQYINAHVTFTIPPKATDQNTTESTPVVVTYPTYDYFQASRGQEQYRESGVFLPMQMSKYPKPCSLRLAGVIPASRVGIKPATSTIMGIREEDVREAGCLTIAQVVENINEFNSGLVELGYPPVKLMLYLMAKWINEDSVVVRGGPYSEPYQARSVGIPDGTPAIPMALVLPDSTEDFMVKQRVGSSYQITVDVKYEPGPWNSIFTSPTYYAFIYILVGLNAGFVFYGLVAVGKLIAAKQLKLERRNVIFAISVTSTLLFITTLPMPIRRQTSIVIGQFSTVLFTLAFYLLLYTWNWLFAAIHPGRHVATQRIIICLSGGLLIAFYLIQVIDTLIIIDDSVRIHLLQITVYCIPSLQAVNALIFIYFTVVFFVTGRKHRIHGKTYTALTKLSYIGAVGFLGILILSIGNFITVSSKGSTTPVRVTIMHVFTNIGYTLRAIALLFIFGVRMPSKRVPRRNDFAPSSGAYSSHLTPIRRLAKRFGLSRYEDSCDLSTQQSYASSGSSVPKSNATTSKEIYVTVAMPQIKEEQEDASNSDATLCSGHSDNDVLEQGRAERKADY